MHAFFWDVDKPKGKKYLYSLTNTDKIQKSETEIMIESYFQIISDKVSANKLMNVYNISDQLHKLENKTLELRKIN